MSDNGLVTLAAARAAFHVIERCDKAVILAEIAISLEAIGDYLAQQVPIEVLKNENERLAGRLAACSALRNDAVAAGDRARCENNAFRSFIETTMRSTVLTSAEVNRLNVRSAQINIAIARGHLPVNFEEQLIEWTK